MRGFALRYARPCSVAPPGIEPTDLTGLGRSLVPAFIFAVDVEGNSGVESGCEMPGVAELRTWGVTGTEREGGGCGGDEVDGCEIAVDA